MDPLKDVQKLSACKELECSFAAFQDPIRDEEAFRECGRSGMIHHFQWFNTCSYFDSLSTLSIFSYSVNS